MAKDKKDKKAVGKGAAAAIDRAQSVAIPDALAERFKAGKELRERVPREAHAEWTPPKGRGDPVKLLQEQGKTRVQDLVPVRYGRMLTSPFAFLRGSAIVMTDDLANTPRTDIMVQACGDAHLANFGVFATPERNVVFDINDFDETLPGPWEWDVKRLAASFTVSGRHRGFTDAQSRLATYGMVRAYQLRMRELAAMRNLDVWYDHIDAQMIVDALKGAQRKQVEQNLAKARLKDHLQAQAKMTEVVDGQRVIKNEPPLLVRVTEEQADAEIVRAAFADYRKTLQLDRQALLSRYRFVDVAQKVVGVGSVGTLCLIVLMEGRDDGDPLFLQIKEASASVLERHMKKSKYRNHGQRVVEGQRMTQAASDIFLGWIQGRGAAARHFYWRQLRDVKGSADLETIQPPGLIFYGEVCGAALARAHARSGDPAMITGYLGTGPTFANAVATFAEAYADQTERDHAALQAAAAKKRIKVVEGL